MNSTPIAVDSLPNPMTASVEKTSVFRAVDVTKAYQMGEVQVRALRGVTLDLYDREFCFGGSSSMKLRRITLPAPATRM